MKELCQCRSCGEVIDRTEAIEVWPVANPEQRFHVCRPDATYSCFRQAVGGADRHAIGRPG